MLIWSVVLLLPVSIYGVWAHLPNVESKAEALGMALALDLGLVMLGIAWWRKHLHRVSDGALGSLLALVYFILPSLWAILEVNSLFPKTMHPKRYEVIDQRKAPASNESYLFLWTGEQIRRLRIRAGQEALKAMPGDSVTLEFRIGLLGLKTIDDVHFRR